MAQETVHIRIQGRVQGVFYRQWTMSEARARGLSGWVRNRVDGSVEAVFKGETDVINDMVRACKRGSPRAFVTKVEYQLAPDAEMEPVVDGVFDQKRTV